MNITREDLIKKLSQESGYCKQDLRNVLRALDDIVLEYFSDVDENEETSIQLVKGIKVGVKVLPERQRKNPLTQEDIICGPQTKPFAKFSVDFRNKIQNQYEEKKDD